MEDQSATPPDVSKTLQAAQIFFKELNNNRFNRAEKIETIRFIKVMMNDELDAEIKEIQALKGSV